VTANITLSDNELRRIYSEKYFKGEEYRDYIDERPTIEKHFRLRLRTLLRFVPPSRRIRLLEIGSAYGFFLCVAKDHFAEVQGIDIAEAAVQYANEEVRVPVALGDFLKYQPLGSFDVACLWDTIEHVPAPHLYLEKVARHLNPGGVVAITTGDIGSLVARLRGPKWRQIHPPSHLHYFSRHTLTRLLSNYGLTVRYGRYDGMYRRLDMIAHIILRVRHQQHRLYRFIKKTGLLEHDIYLNLRDIMFVIAEKTH
jgi:2-polyprenyl-3-methyl-5-hydroxy-6-metoxy-1,4-benzoquinol methylase